MSRMGLAEVICKSQNCQLNIHDEKQLDYKPTSLHTPLHDSSSNNNNISTNSNIDNNNNSGNSSGSLSTWTVYPVSRNVCIPKPIPTGDQRTFIRQRDLTMDCLDTVQFMNASHSNNSCSNSTDSSRVGQAETDSRHLFRFTPLEECISDCFHVNILST